MGQYLSASIFYGFPMGDEIDSDEIDELLDNHSVVDTSISIGYGGIGDSDYRQYFAYAPNSEVQSRDGIPKLFDVDNLKVGPLWNAQLMEFADSAGLDMADVRIGWHVTCDLS